MVLRFSSTFMTARFLLAKFVGEIDERRIGTVSSARALLSRIDVVVIDSSLMDADCEKRNEDV
jgi:hypothetical protein